MPNQFSDLSTDERVTATEEIRRRARFKAAEARIKAIVDAAPEFTEDQLRHLSILLTPPESR